MAEFSLTTPVVLILFKRPDVTQHVFEAIRQAQPRQLLVIADGARPDRGGEAEQCAITRAIIDQVDWDCQVLKNYSDQNLGCKNRVSSGLDWVFEQVESAIILEEDCLPHPSFFQFCQELLAYYRDDPRVMTIAGDNTPLGFQQRRQTQASYHFSIYARIWGWATWRRAWRLYDRDLSHWQRFQSEGWLQDILPDASARQVWQTTLQSNYNGVDTWACRWLFSHWLHHGLTLIPQHNLICNIGFSAEASNTTDLDNPRAHAPTRAMSFPLIHPDWMIADRFADRFTQEQVYGAGLWVRAQRKMRRILKQVAP